MTALTFPKTYTLKQKTRAMSKYAAAIRLLQSDPAAIARIHGTMAAGMARHGLLSNHFPRTVTPFGSEWAADYDGPIADVSEITPDENAPRGSRYRANRVDVSKGLFRGGHPTGHSGTSTIMMSPRNWIFVHIPALQKLEPYPFYLLAWLGSHRDTRTVDAIASAVGWSAEAVSIALRAIRDAGYTVDIVGESAAD